MPVIKKLFSSFTGADWIEILLLVVAVVSIYFEVIGRLKDIETSNKLILEKFMTVKVDRIDKTAADILEELKRKE
jgi:hypothetical protein